MRFLLGMCVLFTLPLWANTQVTTKIHDIDHGDHIGDEALVFLASGQVVKMNVQNTELLERLNRSLVNRDWVTFDIDDQRQVVTATPAVVEETEVPAYKSVSGLLNSSLMAGYTPSVVSADLAKKLHRMARRTSKEETQCFNRAHVWTYEWRVKENVYSNKIWIFFTRKYIRRYNFEWWFHVAPMIHMAVDGQVKERVMDIKYTSGPLTIQKWANIFLRDDAKCPFVTRYSEHANFPESGSCFIQKSPMYYYQPVDLEFYEKFGSRKAAWVEQDVRWAYGEAFDIYP